MTASFNPEDGKEIPSDVKLSERSYADMPEICRGVRIWQTVIKM
jgi:hypothetical protein